MDRRIPRRLSVSIIQFTPIAWGNFPKCQVNNDLRKLSEVNLLGLFRIVFPVNDLRDFCGGFGARFGAICVQRSLRENKVRERPLRRLRRLRGCAPILTRFPQEIRRG
jgi:hypothetical protein